MMKEKALIFTMILCGTCFAQEWQLVGFENQSIASIAIDPKDNNVLYVASGKNIFKTTDGGAQWDTLSFERRIIEIILSPI
ncbi:MAG: hypothetical protein GWN62_32510, partial [Aliifodinibius sp.]|nr:hypothetical protein [candidate division KSB1 bacterium]NIV15810.1 hypothetical protein [Fodinibius sp.]